MRTDKIVLLNPPGKKLYIRDYFCSKVSQADYIYHPTDLLMISAALREGFELHAIDAIAGGLSAEAALAQVAAIRPAAAITLMGAVSAREDFEFIARLKALLPGTKIIGIGDLFSEEAAGYLESNPALDAVLLDFTTDDIACYLNADLEKLRNMVYRSGGGIVSAPRDKEKPCCDGIPVHALFDAYSYRHPFVRARRFATVLIDYGCPFKCSFCIMQALGFKTRPVKNIHEELLAIHARGIREILFITQTFGAHRALAEAVCDLMISEKLSFGWVCFSRVDIVTPSLLEKMKQAGCHTIIFGIESGSERILRHYRKGYSTQQILSTVNYARGLGIETVGTFILGLPEEDSESMRQTLALLKKIKLDYASFNVAVPRPGTDLRNEARSNGLFNDVSTMDQSGTTISMPTRTLSREDIMGFRRRAVCAFYLRPAYILGRLLSLRSFSSLFRQVRQAISLVKNTWLS